MRGCNLIQNFPKQNLHLIFSTNKFSYLHPTKFYLMNDKQENQFGMLVRVESRLSANLTIVNSKPPLAAARLALQAQIAGIRATDIIATSNTTGVARDKASLRSSLDTSCEGLGFTLAAYAGNTGNNTLYAEVYKPLSEIKGIRDDSITTFARLLHSRATTHLANLADYGVTVASLSAFQTLINTYDSDSQKPKIAIDDRKAAVTSLKTQIKDSLVWTKKVLDKLVIPLRATHPDFVAAYLNDRAIVDTGSRGPTPPPPTPPS